MSSSSLSINGQTSYGSLWNPLSSLLAKIGIGSKQRTLGTTEGAIHVKGRSLPPEICAIILKFCNREALLRFSEVNYWAYCQVFELFNLDFRSALSLVRTLEINEDHQDNFINKFLKTGNTQISRAEIIGKREKEKSLFKKSLCKQVIAKGIDPCISKFFQSNRLFSFNKSFLKKNPNLLGEPFAEESFLREQFTRNMIFSRPFLKRGSITQAATLFLKNNTYNRNSEGYGLKITIQDLEKIGLLSPKKMPTTVCSSSSEDIPVEDVSPSRLIPPEHAAFIYKNFFTLCTQVQEPDIEAFLKIPAQYIRDGVQVNRNEALDADTRASILHNMLTSNMFYHDDIYNQISGITPHPLHLHAYFDEAFFESLLQAHFNIEHLDASGLSPLDNALIRKGLHSACFLIKHGAAIHWNAEYLNELLWITVQNGDVDNLKETIKRKGNANTFYLMFPSLLSWAIEMVEAKFEIIKVLVESGADINQQDLQGRTPLDIAIKCKRNDIVVFLQENGALTSDQIPFWYKFIPTTNFCITMAFNFAKGIAIGTIVGELAAVTAPAVAAAIGVSFLAAFHAIALSLFLAFFLILQRYE